LVDLRNQLAPSQPNSGIVSFLGSIQKHGRWELPRRIRAVAVLGSVEIDLRDASIGVGLSVIEAVSVLGSIEIIVPPEIAIECDGDALLGTFALEYEGRVNTALAGGDRTVRVIGSAYAASVTVRVKGPEEDLFAKLGRNLGLTRRDR
jgi:hypothetical protein